MTTAEASLRSQPNDADIHLQTDDLINDLGRRAARGSSRPQKSLLMGGPKSDTYTVTMVSFPSASDCDLITLR